MAQCSINGVEPQCLWHFCQRLLRKSLARQDDRKMKASSRGFSLTELILAVAIVGILGAIAMPSYDMYLRRGTRAAAQSFLTDVYGQQAKFLIDSRNYTVGATALTDLSLTIPSEVSPYYTVLVENSTGGATVSSPPTFRVRATPISGTRQASDGELILTHDGAKSRGGTSGW